MTFKAGDLVRVRAFDNQVHTRQIVRTEADVAVITTPEEYELAVKEEREPVCLGFPLSDVEKVDEP
jgi:hypothetical protein